jgi:hypothetical protein
MSLKELHRLSSARIYILYILFALWFGIPAESALAAASVPPSPGAIRVENRLAGTQDLVTVTGLSAGDVIKVYADEGSTAPLGSATVGSGLNSASVSAGQLGAAGGHIFVTVTQPSFSESRRIVKTFPPELISVAPASLSIRVVNNYGGAVDQVIVQKLQAGDTVKVYSDEQMNQLLGSASAQNGSINGTVVQVGQLGSGAGLVYVTVTQPGQRESRATEKAYAGESRTPQPQLGQIRISNALNGLSDHVQVGGLQPGDLMQIYATEQASIPLAQASVASGSNSADAVLPQLGTGEGMVFITVTRPPLQESARVSKRYQQEPVTVSPAPGTINITNEAAGTDDRIELNGLLTGDLVKVYSSADSSVPLATTSVTAGSAKAVVTIPQLGKDAGFVYITLSSTSQGESQRVVKAYAAELASAAAESSDIRIRNAVGPNDTVTVFGLKANDTVQLYADEASTLPMGSATVEAGAVSAVVQTSLRGTGDGVIYITVTRSQEEESRRVAKIYPAEPVTSTLSPLQIRISNLMDSTNGDEVSVLELEAGDTVRLYSDIETTSALQTIDGTDAVATVGTGESVLTINRLRLDSMGGEIYVTVTSLGKRESDRTLKVYEAE